MQPRNNPGQSSWSHHSIPPPPPPPPGSPTYSHLFQHKAGAPPLANSIAAVTSSIVAAFTARPDSAQAPEVGHPSPAPAYGGNIHDWKERREHKSPRGYRDRHDSRRRHRRRSSSGSSSRGGYVKRSKYEKERRSDRHHRRRRSRDTFSSPSPSRTPNMSFRPSPPLAYTAPYSHAVAPPSQQQQKKKQKPRKGAGGGAAKVVSEAPPAGVVRKYPVDVNSPAYKEAHAFVRENFDSWLRASALQGELMLEDITSNELCEAFAQVAAEKGYFTDEEGNSTCKLIYVQGTGHAFLRTDSRNPYLKAELVKALQGLEGAMAAGVSPSPVLRWGVLDRGQHHETIELLRLLAYEVGIFRGIVAQSFKEQQMTGVARGRQPVYVYPIEVSLEYKPEWKAEREKLLVAKTTDHADPFQLPPVVTRDPFLLRQYCEVVRPFIFNWDPLVTRVYVDVKQDPQKPNVVPKIALQMGPAFLLRPDMDEKRGQVFLRRWVRHCLALFSVYSRALMTIDVDMVSKSMQRLAGTEPGLEPGSVELLNKAMEQTPHFGTLNFCVDVDWIHRELVEFQQFARNYRYTLYVRQEGKVMVLAGTARSVPPLPDSFRKLFLPSGRYVGPEAFLQYVDTALGMNDGFPVEDVQKLLKLQVSGSSEPSTLPSPFLEDLNIADQTVATAPTTTAAAEPMGVVATSVVANNRVPLASSAAVAAHRHDGAEGGALRRRQVSEVVEENVDRNKKPSSSADKNDKSNRKEKEEEEKERALQQQQQQQQGEEKKGLHQTASSNTTAALSATESQLLHSVNDFNCNNSKCTASAGAVGESEGTGGSEQRNHSLALPLSVQQHQPISDGDKNNGSTAVGVNDAEKHQTGELSHQNPHDSHRHQLASLFGDLMNAKGSPSVYRSQQETLPDSAERLPQQLPPRKRKYGWTRDLAAEALYSMIVGRENNNSNLAPGFTMETCMEKLPDSGANVKRSYVLDHLSRRAFSKD